MALASFTVVVTAVLLAAILLSGAGRPGIDVAPIIRSGEQNITLGLNATIRPSLNEGQKNEALRIALSDPDVKNAINSTGGKYDVAGIDYLSPSDAGYVGVNGTFALVSIQASSIMERIYYDVIVDVANKKEMGVRYVGSPIIMMSLYDWAIVPPGAYWYHHIINGTGISSRDVAIQTIRAGVYYEPEDAVMYPIIVDAGNLSRLRNGSPYEAIGLIDSSTGKPVKVDGTMPVASGWRPNLTMPPVKLKIPGYYTGDYYADLYIVIRNGEKGRDVKVKLDYLH